MPFDVRQAMMRNPSYFISCNHSSPEGARSTFGDLRAGSGSVNSTRPEYGKVSSAGSTTWWEDREGMDATSARPIRDGPGRAQHLKLRWNDVCRCWLP